MELPLPLELVPLALDAAVGVGEDRGTEEIDNADVAIVQIRNADAQVHQAQGQDEPVDGVELGDPGIKIAVELKGTHLALAAEIDPHEHPTEILRPPVSWTKEM